MLDKEIATKFASELAAKKEECIKAFIKDNNLSEEEFIKNFAIRDCPLEICHDIANFSIKQEFQIHSTKDIQQPISQFDIFV